MGALASDWWKILNSAVSHRDFQLYSRFSLTLITAER